MTGFFTKFNTGMKWVNLFLQPEVGLRPCCTFSITYAGTYPERFSYRSTSIGSQILVSNLRRIKNLKVLLNKLSPNTMCNTIDKYIIVTFSIVNNP